MASSRATGGFSCDALRASGSTPYYQPTAFAPLPPEGNPIIQPPAGSGDVLSASLTYPYFVLTGTPPAMPGPLPEAPVTSVVPLPGLNLTNSKAAAVGPYGDSTIPLSAPAGYGISGIQYQKNNAYFAPFSGYVPPGSGPTPAPLPPDFVGVSSTGFTVYFSNAGITGSGTLSYSFLYGTTNNPTTSIPATRVNSNLSIYAATVTGLTPNTGYYVKSVATDSNGSTESTAAEQVTLPSGGTAPTGVIGVPTLVSQTSTSITVSVDTTGITSGAANISILYSTSTPPDVPFSVSTNAAGIYTFVVTGLTPGTNYFFQSVASTGVLPNLISTVSPAIPTVEPTPVPDLTTNVVLPFLIQGPRFNTPYSSALDYYVNVDAVGATLAVGASSIAGTQVYGSLFAGSQVTGDATTNAGVCQADQPYSVTYGTVTDGYFESVGTTQTRRLISWGGYYADILGLFGPYQPAGFPGTNPSATDVVDSICHIYLGEAGVANPLNWSSTGWGTIFDGIILDFENIGLGGRPSSNQYPLPQTQAPVFPASSLVAPYTGYAAALASIPAEFYGQAPAKFLGNAPVSLSINGDLLTGKNAGNIGASNTALNNWFAFQTSSTVPSAVTYNNQPNVNALNHPSVMKYFDDIFVQFYNENAEYYPGGTLFPNLLAQWGYVALLAQLEGAKKPRINIGLAKGNIIPGGSPAVAAAQGPTPPLDAEPGPPYEFWYPQYCTVSPPNAVSGQSQNWPNTGVFKDPANIANAITSANAVLQQAFSNPNLLPTDWCSGMGFWAGTAATAMAKSVYTSGDTTSPGAILPAINTYCWSDASYPSPDPNWPGQVPVVSTL